MACKYLSLFLVIFSFCSMSATTHARERWTAEQANAWYAKQPWLVGANFIPSTAINQLEMWQADTFDPETIDRELGWAEKLGFTSMRVFLHNLLWEQDKKGFLERMEKFLDIADKHKIGVMFVLLDGVWDPEPKLGKQQAPLPHVHNSGWVQAPGKAILADPKRHDELKPYIMGVIRHFKDDKRVQVWDVFNEPDNPNVNSYGPKGKKTELPAKDERVIQLLRKVFTWARDADPSQPLTAGVWRDSWEADKLSPVNKLMLEESDVVSFHNYGPLADMKRRVELLRRYNRPLLCTEYMARPMGSRFDPVLGYLKEQKIGAYNWGFVAGKSQTIYPWETWQKKYNAEPKVWFHDIYRADGSAYDPREVEYIQGVTGQK
jgi:hypothetical protein